MADHAIKGPGVGSHLSPALTGVFLLTRGENVKEPKRLALPGVH